MKIECRLHLQLCAIYSQLHRHKNAYEQAEIGVKLAHLIVRDQLAVCHFFAKKQEYAKDKVSTHTKDRKKSKEERERRKNRIRNLIEDSFDDMLQESKDLFYDDNSDQSDDNHNDSFESVYNYMTEKAFHNDMESSMSITEKSGKFILLIYVELLRIIKPLEREQDKTNNKKFLSSEWDDETAHTNLTIENEMNEDNLL